MGIYNQESVKRGAENADVERNSKEEVEVIYGYDDAVGNTAKTTQGLVEGKKPPEIRAQIHGNLATEGKRFGFEGEQDGTEWLVKTNNGELVVVNIESLTQLTEDLRMLPSGYSVKDLSLVVKGKEASPEIYAKATTLFTPEEKIGIASDAVENILLLGDERIGRAVNTFVNGQNEIFIVTRNDYHLLNTSYNPGRPEIDLIRRDGHHTNIRNRKIGQGNGRVYTAEAEIAKDNTQVIVVSEARFFNRASIAVAGEEQEITDEGGKNSARLETSRVLTHELVHGSGIGSHLGPMEEMAVEFYAIRAQTLGEQKRKEKSESLNMGYEAGVSFFAKLYTALQERESLSNNTLDEAFMWGETKEMQEVISAIGHLLGKENNAKLAKWDFKSDAEAYLWLRDKLSQ